MAPWRVPSPTRASLAALRQVTEAVRRRNEIENERATAQKEKVG